MKTDITRDVISDLWPLYASDEASAQTKRIVEEFLAQDAEFRAILKASQAIRKGVPEMTLSADAEMQIIAIARNRARTQMWLIAAAIATFGIVCIFPILAALFYALN
jgi:hypothetical protein